MSEKDRAAPTLQRFCSLPFFGVVLPRPLHLWGCPAFLSLRWPVLFSPFLFLGGAAFFSPKSNLIMKIQLNDLIFFKATHVAECSTTQRRRERSSTPKKEENGSTQKREERETAAQRTEAEEQSSTCPKEEEMNSTTPNGRVGQPPPDGGWVVVLSSTS